MQQFTYFTILFCTVFVCFIFSFHKRIVFYKQFIPFIKSAFVVSIPFLVWDVIFTYQKIWWFNYDYTIGVTIFALPLEEILFFFCIPFSCVFTFFCITKFFSLKGLKGLNNVIVFILIIICVLLGLLHYGKWYTLLTTAITCCILVYFHFVLKLNWIGKATLVYIILLPGFFSVNGLLTGSFLNSPIVNYNSNHIIGLRMFTIPIEDMIYGYAQFLLVLFFYKYFNLKNEE